MKQHNHMDYRMIVTYTAHNVRQKGQDMISSIYFQPLQASAALSLNEVGRASSLVRVQRTVG